MCSKSGPIFGPVPELVQDLIIFGLHFWIPFLKVLELSRCLLGTFLGFPRLSWKALDPNIREKPNVFKVFANAGFLYFEALDGPLGPILAPLGPIWSKMGPQKCHKSCPKSAQKLAQKLTQTNTKTRPIWAPQSDPKMTEDGKVGAQCFQDGGF